MQGKRTSVLVVYHFIITPRCSGLKQHLTPHSSHRSEIWAQLSLVPLAQVSHGDAAELPARAAVSSEGSTWG